VALALSDITDAVDAALSGNRRELAKLLTSIENGAEPEFETEAWTLGVTGPPGVGKSTLIGRLIETWVARGERVAVLAVDPSSPLSGGSLLADRIRMPQADSWDSVFVRSLASGKFPGGLIPQIGTMCQALSACGWTRVIIETVGAGQSEIRVVAFAERILLVDGPDRGDIIQAEKAGILEIADSIAINKSDLPGSENAAKAVRSSLDLSEEDRREVHLVSALNNHGIEALISDIEALEPNSRRANLRNRERLAVSWESLIFSNSEIESVLKKMGNGSITVSDAIRHMGSSIDFGGTGDGSD
jgi:LAO/AO transport system kinase